MLAIAVSCFVFRMLEIAVNARAYALASATKSKSAATIEPLFRALQISEHKLHIDDLNIVCIRRFQVNIVLQGFFHNEREV